MKFTLKKAFVDSYINKQPPFGFNGLGELTYMRTYSRLICPVTHTYDFDMIDGKAISKASDKEMVNERWWQTVKRVVEGTYSIQKRHIHKNGLGWSEYKAHKSAQEMYDRMFNMKFLPPGRGLWAMGTELTESRELFAALNNCAFVSTENIGYSAEEATKPFEFLMDMSMLGVGVGFDVLGEGKIILHQPNDEEDVFVIPDTREGWVESVAVLLRSYFKKNHNRIVFDYSVIRPYGQLIKTFGGKASGPQPLQALHEQLRQKFEGRGGQRITVTDIVDVMNMIGCCVVAGNVRRTAEIVFGDPQSEEYLKLKDYKWDADKQETVGDMAHRAAYGWTSNNSVFSELGMDYTRVGTQTGVNGEPGYAWLQNMQKFGRMVDEPNWKDKRVKGANPCVEQSLESYELCCLVETFPSMHEDFADYARSLKFAYLYAKTVTLGKTHWNETNRVMLRNRRIGTSQSGITQFIQKHGLETYRQWCDQGYHVIQEYDQEYSEWLCIPRSVKTTSIKPSGTVSLLPGVTPGMHFTESNYHIRRIRISEMSELVDICKQAGMHVEKDVVSQGTMVVSIPVKIDGVRTVNEVSMWEQLSLAALIQRWWADNQVSCTVTFKPEEADQIKHALNYFQYQLKGVSFLPKTEQGSYAQMPYEEITKEQYDQMVKDIKPLNFNGMSEDSVPEKFCDSSSCEI